MKKFMYAVVVLIMYLSITCEDSEYVFNEIDKLDSYYVEIENLNTNNILCIKNLNIQAIEVDVNYIYKFDRVFFYKNLNYFIKNVIRRLKENGYYIEANKYLIEPIRIKKMLVFNTKKDIIEYLNKCNVKYNIYSKNT